MRFLERVYMGYRQTLIQVEEPIHNRIARIRLKPLSNRAGDYNIIIMDCLRVPIIILSLICTGSLLLTQADEMLSNQMGLRITSLGATETIRCLKENQGNNLVVWSHKGEHVSINGIIFTTNQDHRNRYSVKGDSESGHYNLQIQNIKHEDTGTWECKYGRSENIENVIKTVVIVIPPDEGFPTCDISTSPSTIRIGDPFQLTCTSSGGFPAPTLVWRRDGVELSRKSDGDVLVLDRVAEQSDYNVRYSCELESLALPTSPTCTQQVMVLPTEAPTSRGATQTVSTLRTKPTVFTTKQPNTITQKSNVPPEQRTTMTNRPTTAIYGSEKITRPTVTSSDSSSSSNTPNESHLPVTNSRENRNQITESVSQEVSSSNMFDALTAFGLLSGVFLILLILMAVSWRRGHSKAIKKEEEKITGSTETLTEENPNWVRPYSTITLNSSATTESVYDIPRMPSVFRTSYIDTSTGQVVSSIVIDDPNKLYKHEEVEHYYSNMPLYSKVKK
ncbi:uncharacterized protein LOC117120845 [Anneissia japonica]|uniref:uncharacterized protein LOC117120845 n=1 Tax=Anneissia japonica TaxID=1529436 RepID=UPI001425B037|nr:uncharacterized protein LOC117120845 [Anneissia japonica]